MPDGCFFDFQCMRESPRRIMKPDTHFLVLMHPHQSLFEQAFRCAKEVVDRRMPCPCIASMYLKTRLAT